MFSIIMYIFETHFHYFYGIQLWIPNTQVAYTFWKRIWFSCSLLPVIEQWPKAKHCTEQKRSLVFSQLHARYSNMHLGYGLEIQLPKCLYYTFKVVSNFCATVWYQCLIVCVNEFHYMVSSVMNTVSGDFCTSLPLKESITFSFHHCFPTAHVHH